MRLMVLDSVKPRRNRFRAAVERPRQRFSYTGEFRKNLRPSARKRWHAQRVEKLCAQPRIRISRHRYMIDFLKLKARFLQAVSDRLRRKFRRALHPIETLPLH